MVITLRIPGEHSIERVRRDLLFAPHTPTMGNPQPSPLYHRATTVTTSHPLTVNVSDKAMPADANSEKRKPSTCERRLAVGGIRDAVHRLNVGGHDAAFMPRIA